MTPPAETAPIFEEAAKREYEYGFITDIDPNLRQKA